MPRVYQSPVKESSRKAPWKAPILILHTSLCMLLRMLLKLLLLRMLLLRRLDILLLRRLLRLISLVKLSLIPLVILISLLILITRLKFRLLPIRLLLIRLLLIMLLMLVLWRVHNLGWTRLWRRSPRSINSSKSRAPPLSLDLDQEEGVVHPSPSVNYQ